MADRTKADEYRGQLRARLDWDEYLLAKSGLPGPRGNLELAQVVAEEGDLLRFRRYLAYTPERAPVNSPYEFLSFCGVVGLGRLVAEGELEHLPTLRAAACDPRWRMREGVAMALQRLGEADMDRLVAEMRAWSQGTSLEQRAAVAALCEPRLLQSVEHARAALQILDRVTASIKVCRDRRSPEFQALRKGLGYCWSVAVSALPEEGKTYLEKWLADPDADVRWVMKENLKKTRLERMDADWVQQQRARINSEMIR